jgi:hypothetical protein
MAAGRHNAGRDFVFNQTEKDFGPRIARIKTNDTETSGIAGFSVLHVPGGECPFRNNYFSFNSRLFA